MPLNVRRFYSSIFLAPAFFLSISYSQITTPSSSPQPVNTQVAGTQAQPLQAPTSGEVMRDRITKAKAYIAVRNYNAAIYELENIRKETADPAVQSVTNVLLMNSYLELGDYKRAQGFLNQFYAEQKTTKSGALAAYSAVAGQVVAGARNRAERYKALGLDPMNRLLPLEALNDLQNMRDTLELVITQSKEIGQTPAKTKEAMAILEEATGSRAMLARDTYDAKKWRDEVGDTREAMTTGNMKVLTATTEDGVNSEVVAPNNTPANNAQPPSQQPVNDNSTAAARPRTVPDAAPPQTAKLDTPVYVPTSSSSQPDTKLIQKTVMQQPVNQPAPQPRVQETAKADAPKTEAAADAAKSDKPVDVGGSLLSYATEKPTPVVPAAARAMHTTGVVRVDVTVDEKGDVVDVQKASGPGLLQAAAKDAIKKWKFKPFLRDGQPVKANGFVNFNFAL
ncbi:MAG: TonB family protein [Pyrinomonadaceae bacterium]